MTQSAPACVVIVAAALLCFACDEPTEVRPEFVTADPQSIRLADLLEVASIESPLTEIDPANSLQDLGDVPRQTVLQQDFEQFDPEKAGWPTSENGIVAASGDGQAFLLRSHELGEQRGWLVRVEPSTHYVFERLVKTDATLDADFAVVEADNVESILEERKRDPNLKGHGAAVLKVHWPETPVADGSWQRGSVSLFTTPHTRALGVFLRATADRRGDLLRWGKDKATEHAAWFDDLRLERLEPSAEQTIALLKARDLAEGADPFLGIEKHGQFPPAALTSRDKLRYDNYSYRYALYAPPPTDLTFPFTLKPGSVLRFSVCLSQATQSGHAARFDVIARANGREETIWSRTLRAEMEEWLWYDERVDLSTFAGQAVELVLRTTAVEGDPHPMWANPTIDLPYEGDATRNVILIGVDTLRADRLSCYGYSKKTSPNFDALSADGVRFDQVASNAAWTSPSFTSILTGIVPSRHGVWSPGHVMRLQDRFDTLAELFRNHGWATHAIAFKAPLYKGGLEQGFDVSFNGPFYAVGGEENLEEAMQWLEANADRRNFLFLHFDDPHQPFTQPSPFDTAFGADPADHGIRLPYHFRKAKPNDDEMRGLVSDLYDGAIAFVDDRIGAFLDALKSRGLYDDAVIVLVADHGEAFWEHGLFGHGEGHLHDEVIRVPLIVKPGRGDFARGTVVDTQVRGFDVMPTLLELVGIPVPEGVDAQSLVPFLAVGTRNIPDRLAVIESNRSGMAIRNQRWKYIQKYSPPPRQYEGLFDLQADPGELENVASEYPDVVERMRLTVLDYLMTHRSGRYLVIIGENTPAQSEHQVEGATSAATLFGNHPTRAADRCLTFAGETKSPLVLVAQLDTAGPVTVDGTEHLPGDFRRYATGDLERLVRAAIAGVHLFEGPLRKPDESTAVQTMDLRQLEAMRALGYTGDGPDTRDDR